LYLSVKDFSEKERINSALFIKIDGEGLILSRSRFRAERGEGEVGRRYLMCDIVGYESSDLEVVNLSEITKRMVINADSASTPKEQIGE
jgi:hypothetical protein